VSRPFIGSKRISDFRETTLLYLCTPSVDKAISKVFQTILPRGGRVCEEQNTVLNGLMAEAAGSLQ